MNRDFIDQIKHEFSFLDISDDTFDKLFKSCIDSKKDDEVNKEKIYKVLYGIISDNFIETGSFFDIEKYIEGNFDISTLEKCIESLNNLSDFLTKCKVDINRDNYNRIFKISEPFVKCLKTISTSNELNKKQKDVLLSEKSLDILDFYNEDNNYYNCDYSGDFDISDEEFEREIISDELLEDPSITSDALKLYLKEINKIPLLTPEEEYRLTKLYRETHDKKVRAKIIESNLRLVVSVAKKINTSNISLTLLDLISAGNTGLIRALQDYDPDKARFTTYARPWIYQKIRREIQDNANTIRVPVHVQEKMFEYNKYKKELEDILGREPNVEEIKKATGLSYKKINEYENNISNTISLHTKIVTTDRDSSELGDFISDTKDVIPEEIIIKKDPESINVLFVGLTEIEKTIMLLRTGIYNGTEYTLDRIAVILHRLGLKDNTLTREGIRQLEKKAIRKIKVNYEQDALTMSLPEEKKVIKCEKPTLKDFIILLRTTDKEILYNAINALSDRDKIVINECFGMDIVKAKLKKTTPNMIENLLEQVYTRLLYEVNKRVHSKKIREATLPQNIYNIDSTRDKNDVEKQIDELQPFERLVLNKFYDMYTGELRNVTNVTFYEKEQIVIIVDKIRKGLFDVKRTSTRIDDNQEKNTVTRNNLFEYFGLENKEAVLVIISSLEETEISFLKKWYGENYDENPKDKVDYKDMDKLEKARIFNKIRIRLDKYKKLVGQGKTVDINTFVKSKYVDRRSKDNIYTYFENGGYTEEEITQANSELSENDKTLLREYYGSDLKRPIINDYMPEELKQKVLVGIFRKVQKKLEKNKSNKILRKALNND